MLELCRFSGILAAHGFRSIAAGSPLISTAAHELPNATRQMRRMAAEDRRQAVELGQAPLGSQPEEARIAALIHDGYVAFGKVAVPYRPADHPEGLAVHRSKFLEFRTDEGASPEDTGHAFFAGFDSHAEAAPIWNRSLDESP
jgi:hypothetical protein